jgi:hypothetical protein
MLLSRFMPAGKVVPAFERRWLALMLTVLPIAADTGRC